VNALLVCGVCQSIAPAEDRPSGTPRRYFQVLDEGVGEYADDQTFDCVTFGSLSAQVDKLRVGEWCIVQGRLSRGGKTNKRTSLVVSQLQVLGSQDENDLGTT